MISYEDALAPLLALAEPLGDERVPLTEAAGRTLAKPVIAPRDQPPFAAASMDGYALRSVDAAPGARLAVAGESAAGRRWNGHLPDGACVRIFTGAPVPPGCDRVVIQEDVTRERDEIVIGADPDPGPYIRPAGWDFAAGARLAAGPLTPARIALAAAMGATELTVARRPTVAILPTGDELVLAGEAPGPDEIVSSNGYGVAAMLRAAGAEPRLLPPAPDEREGLARAIDLTRGADLILTIGGASVGDHDLVGEVAGTLGLDRSFYKVAMRPGKPLMAGRMDGAAFVGLPGNPVSAMVCARVFGLPMIRRMLGQPPEPAEWMPLAAPVEANGARRHFMRARIEGGAVRPMGRQDSSLLTVLSEADTLLVRPPHDPPRPAGHDVEVRRL